MRRFLKKFGICFLIFVLMLPVVYINSLAKSSQLERVGLSYFEDTTGKMEISDIENKALKCGFVENDASFTFGRSRSTFWIKIPTENPELLKNYIALFCPNIQDVQLYIPAENGYEVRNSGWANSLSRDDEGMTYPVFRLDSDAIGEKPIYMRIQSDYAHNYMLEFFTQKELDQVRVTEFCLNSFLFGMLIAVVLTNLIVFFKLKNKIFLSFLVCILLLTIHQGISYGMYNVIIPAHSYVLMSLSIEIGLLFIISIIVFFIIYSNVKTYNKLYYRCLLFFIAACLIDYPVCLMDKITANFYGHFLTIVIPIFILYISFRMHRAGYKDQRLFMTGWGLTILLYVAAMLVCEGMIQMGGSTVHFPTELIIMLTVSMVFTVAITERTKRLQVESQQVRQQYQAVSEQVKRTETALMQTQIKPHFLYNTLTAIEQLCAVDSHRAEAAIADFSNYLRSNIDFSTETRLIFIEKELENVRHYLSLEQMRFEERLNVTCDIRAGGFMIPPLVVQPIVENAVRHGVTKKPEGGTISILVGETETAYLITVADNGVGFNPEHAYPNGGSHIGIRNARERLARMCGGTLVIDSQFGVGTTVNISIAKELEDEPILG